MKEPKQIPIFRSGVTPKAPQFRRSLFWDVNPKTIDLKKNARYVVERIMDFGNDAEVRWMWGVYSKPLMRDITKHSRVLRPKSRALWELLTKSKLK